MRLLRPLIFAAVLALVAVGTSAGQRASPPQDRMPTELVGLDAYVEAAMRAWKVPGLSLVVVKGDRVVYERGYGVREVGRPEPVDAHTVFAVASNTKAVPAAALATLVDRGRLSWDARVADLLPGFALSDPWATRELTVRDLLSHRTGYETWGGDLLWYGSDFSTAEVLRRVRYLQPVTSFRSSWGYSNLMFVAAGEIVPALTDTSWSDYVGAHFTGPLGMTRTSVTTAALAGQANVAAPHTLVDGRVAAVPYRALDSAAPAAALNSSAHDWAQWLRLQVTGGVAPAGTPAAGRRLVSARGLAELRQPHSLRRIGDSTRRNFPSTHLLAYGLGWDLRDYRGRYLASHTGGMDGMLSMTGVVPEDSLAVAVFTNYDEQNLYSALFWHVLDRMMGAGAVDYSARVLSAQIAPVPPVRDASAPVRGPVAAFAGTYTHPMLGWAVVAPCAAATPDALCIALDHFVGLRGPLAPWHHDTFEATWGDVYFRTSLVAFERDAAGRVARLRFRVRPDFVDPQEYVMVRE